MSATLSHVSISLAVTVVATIEVVPWLATVAAMISSAFARALHHVVPAGAVNVDIEKARHDALFPQVAISHAHGAILPAPRRPIAGVLASLDDDHSIGNLF